MNIFKIIGMIIVLLGVIGLFLINNLWFFLPEFQQLDTVFAIPLSIQALYVLLCVLCMALYAKFKVNILLWICITLFLLSPVMGYRLVFSNSSNTFSLLCPPYFNRTIQFAELESIEVSGDVVVYTTRDRIKAPLGFYPLGINKELLRSELLQYGDCVENSENICSRIGFSLP